MLSCTGSASSRCEWAGPPIPMSYVSWRGHQSLYHMWVGGATNPYIICEWAGPPVPISYVSGWGHQSLYHMWVGGATSPYVICEWVGPPVPMSNLSGWGHQSLCQMWVCRQLHVWLGGGICSHYWQWLVHLVWLPRQTCCCSSLRSSLCIRPVWWRVRLNFWSLNVS